MQQPNLRAIPHRAHFRSALIERPTGSQRSANSSSGHATTDRQGGGRGYAAYGSCQRQPGTSQKTTSASCASQGEKRSNRVGSLDAGDRTRRKQINSPRCQGLPASASGSERPPGPRVRSCRPHEPGTLASCRRSNDRTGRSSAAHASCEAAVSPPAPPPSRMRLDTNRQVDRTTALVSR
jgi:hypothetical protein